MVDAYLYFMTGYSQLQLARAAARPMVASCTNFHTSVARQDIDQAAKYIGAGAATVGVAGSGAFVSLSLCNPFQTTLAVF